MANQRDLEHLQNESKVFLFERIQSITDPFAIIIFQVRENSWDTKPLISIDLSPSDPLANWAGGRVAVRLLPAQTRGLRGGRYHYDLLVVRNGSEFTYEYKGLFKLEATISRTDETVDPVVINDIYANLISTADGKGASLVGVAASFWTGLLGAANLTVERCLRWLNNNKIGRIVAYTGSKLLRSGSSPIEILEAGIEVDTADNVTNVRSLTLLLPPSLDSHATRRDWVVSEIISRIDVAVNALINGAPGALDTIGELAAMFGNDPNFATTIVNLIATKISSSEKGVANGVATLGPDGKVFPEQLPASTASVTSVNGHSGAVVLSNVDLDAAPSLHNHDAVYYTKSQVDSFLFSVVPLGCIIEDNLNQAPSSNFKEANAQAISRVTFSSLWNLVHRTVSGIIPATDRINVTSHGCTEGQLVKFAFTGGGITALAKYYVRNPTTNDFQISTTPSGSILDLTASQSGDMITNVEYGFGDGSTTYNVPDRRGIFVRGAGIHGSRTKATGNNYNAGAVGFDGIDQFQGHVHRMFPRSYQGGATIAAASAASETSGTGGGAVPLNTTAILADTTNGPPRTGDETTPVYVAVKYKVRVL
ncbi:hypothetical protein EHQ12_04020 [Leptospira gomenensis]|uniref:Phage tail protein n=1 Tax=Leptospira gomenensis TaxID=2484974 RepID=A0A5F1YJ04_9LEPT|nr:hypothetical protein [Leptospira gomenensis]TGK36216.1 hypothetical protein EHQ17_04700 [Leptospira gomenensis]TGK42746.1 hypothetical protein EHQ07_13800 [Leptospira gomenensis]TGK42933.1 hypothetical protein EHQ12_04020 [Leptospira gomenensis]TGK54945.1 hypothetical protein EHQ13_18275 [Leptospira gomenensis]